MSRFILLVAMFVGALSGALLLAQWIALLCAK